VHCTFGLEFPQNSVRRLTTGITVDSSVVDYLMMPFTAKVIYVKRDMAMVMQGILKADF
jgi:hypothetical protein